MPLHAEREALVGHLDRLGQLVEVGPAGDHEVLAEPVDPLVVVRERAGVLAAGGVRGREPAARCTG